jgi:penicillin-binding protein 2
MQQKAYEAMTDLSGRVGYEGGAVAIMDIETGEILTLTSYPEYNPNILSSGEDDKTIKALFNDERKPFLNRALGGLYSPGSIVKPFIALAALHEGIITENTRFYSEGTLEVVSPYDPNVVSVFRDWQDEAVGWTDVRKALAESVNNFFYIIGGGYKGQPGLGITKIKKYVKVFGFGSKTNIALSGEVSGVIPDPDWKAKIFNGDIWRLGDTYNTAIGQYGFQVTPIQMLRSVASLANGGKLLTPYIVFDENTVQSVTLSENFSEEHIKIVQEGMRQVVTDGTGVFLNVPYVDSAAKTGTSQTGPRNSLINSWVIGFFPYEQPKYAFVVLMERGPKKADISASFVMRQIMDWIRTERPEYLKIVNTQ